LDRVNRHPSLENPAVEITVPVESIQLVGDDEAQFGLI
jgi:hypothetical protein